MSEFKNKTPRKKYFKICLFWAITVAFTVPAIGSMIVWHLGFIVGRAFTYETVVFASLPIVSMFLYAKCATKIMKEVACDNELYLLYIFTFLMHSFVFLCERFYKI